MLPAGCASLDKSLYFSEHGVLSYGGYITARSQGYWEAKLREGSLGFQPQICLSELPLDPSEKFPLLLKLS